MPTPSREMTRSRALVIAGLAAGSLTLAGCGTESEGPTGVVADRTACQTIVTISLAGDPVSEYAPLYELLGEPYTVDRRVGSVTGPLMAGGEDTGLDIELITGTGAKRPTVLYDEPRIWMAALSTADLIAYSGDFPAVGVFTLFEEEPLTDGGAYPELASVAADPGYRPYPAVMAIRPEFLESYQECLPWLVPILQQAELDFFADPEATTAKLVDIVDSLDADGEDAAGYDIASATAAIERLRTEYAGNGETEALGDIDLTRVAEFTDLVRPILSAAGFPAADLLTPADLATNLFIDEGIGFAP